LLAFISALFGAHTANGSKAVSTAVIIVAFMALLEFMVFSSLKSGRIYFRGFIYKNEKPGKFKMQQFLYALLAGFLVIISLKQFT